jgi:hypothetical protein
MGRKRGRRNNKSKAKQPVAEASEDEQPELASQSVYDDDDSSRASTELAEQDVTTVNAVEDESPIAAAGQSEIVATQADHQDDPTGEMQEKDVPNRDKGKGKQLPETAPPGCPNAHLYSRASLSIQPPTCSIPPVRRPSPIFRRRRWGWPLQPNNGLVPVEEIKDLIDKLQLYSDARSGEEEWDALNSGYWLSILHSVCAYAERCTNIERGTMTDALLFLGRFTPQNLGNALQWPMDANGHWTKHALFDLLID